MKKFILSLMLMFSMVMGVSAQTAIETPKFFDNWYVGVNAGATTNLEFNKVFPVNATVGAVLGKEFTPVFGAQIEGVTWLGDANFANSHTAFKAIDLGVNGTVNFSNLFFGYLGTPRRFEVSGVAGIGWLHIYGDHNLDGTYGHEDNDEFITKTAVNLAWNLGKTRSHQLYVQPGIYWNLTNGPRDYVHFNSKHAQVGVSVGYVYKFKTSNGTHNFKTYDVGMMQDEISRLNDALAACENRPPREVTKEVAVRIPVPAFEVIEFELGSYELLDEAKAKLDKIDERMTVEITATASPDGKEQFNKELSDKRAQAVADYLKGRGVTVKSAEGQGVKLNRLAIVTFVRPERPRR
jgi:outer membrane protein OmpA-like peptidoglycan-associated protein